MIDFLMISTRTTKRGIEVYPKFIIKASSDLMIRGGDFYAIWIEELGLWSTDEQDALHLIDKEVKKYFNKDVWEVRNRYIDVILDRTYSNIRKFQKENFKADLTEEEKVKGMELLEIQRQAMLM